MGSADNKPPTPDAHADSLPPYTGNDGVPDEQIPSYQATVSQPPAPPAPLPEITFSEDALLESIKNPVSANHGFDVTESRCLAHLKLLHAFQALKEDVGYTDGLWGIWDSLVADSKGNILDPKEYPPEKEKKDMTEDEEKQMLMSKIREKRWAIFVARAVDRYEAWWSQQDIIMLTEEDMTMADSDAYMRFPSTNRNFNWTTSTLPPLGKNYFLLFAKTKSH